MVKVKPKGDVGERQIEEGECFLIRFHLEL
jgi:hypothetical protein